MKSTVHEPPRETAVYDWCDVLVVGGGPAGVTAAVAAKNSGAERVVLMERCAYLGGMATGGQVLLIPFLSDPILNGGREQLVAGLMNEWVDRLRACPNGAFGPQKWEIGSKDPEVLAKYRSHGLFIRKERVMYGVNCDPEMLKAVLNDMTEAAGVVVYCNCLGCQAVVEDVKATGVIFESKEGRKAVMAQVIVDCTGDGDIFATAGAGYESASLTTSRTANTSLVFRLGGVSYERYTKGLRETPSAREKLREAVRIAGYDMQIISSNRDDVVWIDSLIPRDCMTITGLTDTAFITTRTINPLIRYLRENFPGLEGAYLYDFASQVGTRGSRRLKGVERFTMDDIGKHTGREDIIAVLPTVSGLQAYPRMEMPYGVLVPEKLDGLLVAGRCFSSSEEANQEANWIPHCIALGQAAGTAAAMAVKERIQPREVEPKSLRGILREQGVYL